MSGSVASVKQKTAGIECPKCGTISPVIGGPRIKRCPCCREILPLPANTSFTVMISSPTTKICRLCRKKLPNNVGKKCPECGEPIPKETTK